MLQHATFLGDSTSILIVFENDIYLRQSPTEQVDVKLTSTGKPDVIYNGIPDWLYQGNMKKCILKWYFLMKKMNI